jgi:hypothetical protein
MGELCNVVKMTTKFLSLLRLRIDHSVSFHRCISIEYHPRLTTQKWRSTDDCSGTIGTSEQEFEYRKFFRPESQPKISNMGRKGKHSKNMGQTKSVKVKTGRYYIPLTFISWTRKYELKICFTHIDLLRRKCPYYQEEVKNVE